jgi:hypothetical protein
VPTAFAAHGNATTRVRSESSERSWSRSSRHSSSTSANFTVNPRSWAISSQGETFASWSRRVQTISSPATHSRDAARDSAKFSVVMFAPNATSSTVAFRKRAAVACARSSTTSVACDVANGPPVFAFASRK